MDKDGYTFAYADQASGERIVIPLPATWGLATSCMEFLEKGICSTHENHVLRFQEDGVRWMFTNPKDILLADEMGLGKTLQTVLLFNCIVEQKNRALKILIVCPNNAKLVWKQHCEQLLVRQHEIELVSTSLCMGLGDILIANYEAVVKWDTALVFTKWDIVVFDEGHKIKNPSAKRSRACYSIRGEKNVIITGTPIVNYAYEVFPLIHYLDPENHPSASRHERLYGGRGNSRFGYNLNRLNSLLRATIMLRRRKKDVLTELPAKWRRVIEYEAPEDLQKLIEEEKKLWKEMKSSVTAAQAQMLSAMANESDTAMSDVDWASIIDSLMLTKRTAFTEMSRIAHLIGIAKIPFIIEHVEDLLENVDKVVVFGHHRDVLQAIHKHFGQKSVLLIGGNSNQPQAIVDAQNRFNNDPNCRVFVGGIKIAEAYSLRGTSTVVFTEQSWIPGEYTQSEDRCHGIGRGEIDASRLNILHITFQDSLDTEKAQLNIQKQRSIDRAMNR